MFCTSARGWMYVSLIACHILVYGIISMNLCQYPPLLWDNENILTFKAVFELTPSDTQTSFEVLGFRASFLRYFSLFHMQIKHIYVTVCHMCVFSELSEVTYLCFFAIDIRNHLKIYMFGVVGETHTHDSF